MASSVTYTTINGQIVHEVRSGVEAFYVPDPLGNTAALADTSGGATDTWTYWPYGETLSHGGSSTTPLAYLGTLGYFEDVSGRLYVRERSFRAGLSIWLVAAHQFALLAGEASYTYGFSMPTTMTDFTGLFPCGGVQTECSTYPGGPCAYAKSKQKGLGLSRVICCDGVKYPCDFGELPGNPPGFHSCTIKHEKEHLWEVSCDRSGYYEPDFDDPSRSDYFECIATAVEWICLLGTRKSDCKGKSAAKCLKDYHEAFCHLCDYLAEHNCVPRYPNCKYCVKGKK
ncbi:MAG TPA: hypothetical protein VKT78_17940 [Fimbriimonadaceae bacterium]|nr:hypothetical protein [Fimbriimonadaceae bacterium]